MSKLNFEDMGALLTEEQSEPEFLIDRLLYRRVAHLIAGRPGCGKSTFAYHCVLTILRQGMTVMVIDEESGTRQVVDKLKALGATPQDVARLRYANFPRLNWTDASDFAEIAHALDAVKPDLVILDSSSPMLAHSGLNEDDNASVQRFWSQITLITRCGPGVLVIDHVVKNGGTNGYARGAGSKSSNADVVYIVDDVKEFSRDAAGSFTLRRTKDRDGYLPEAYKVTVTPGETLTFSIVELQEAGQQQASKREWRGDILSMLQARGPQTQSQLASALGGRKSDMILHLNALVDDEAVSEEDGPRNSKVYSVVPMFGNSSGNS